MSSRICIYQNYIFESYITINYPTNITTNSKIIELPCKQLNLKIPVNFQNYFKGVGIILDSIDKYLPKLEKNMTNIQFFKSQNEFENFYKIENKVVYELSNYTDGNIEIWELDLNIFLQLVYVGIYLQQSQKLDIKYIDSDYFQNLLKLKTVEI